MCHDWLDDSGHSLLKANEIKLYVPNFELARLGGSFSKEKYYRMENFGEDFRKH